MDVDVGKLAEFIVELTFEVGGLGVGAFKGEGGFDFEVEINVKAAGGVVGGDVVDGEMAVVGNGTDAFEDVFFFGGRNGVDDDVGIGGAGMNGVLDAAGDVVCGLDGVVAGDGDAEFDEKVGAGATDADAEDAADAGDLFGGGDDAFGDAFGGGVEEGVHGAFAEPPTDVDDDEGDGKGSEGIGASATDAKANEGKTGHDDEGTPDVGLEMKGVGFECLALVFFGDAGEGA